MPEPLYPIPKILMLLTEAPVRIETATTGLSAGQLRHPPGEGEWSANEVLAHLRACGDVWGDHICAIATEDQPLRKGLNPRTWMKQTNYPDLDFSTSFQAYQRQRDELLALLNRLPPEGWQRRATMKVPGQQYEKTLLRFADDIARHERSHVKQIESIAGRLRAQAGSAHGKITG